MKAGVGGRRALFLRVTVVWVVLIAADVRDGIGRAPWLRVVFRAAWPRILSEYDMEHGPWLALGAAAPALSLVVSAKAWHRSPPGSAWV